MARAVLTALRTDRQPCVTMEPLFRHIDVEFRKERCCVYCICEFRDNVYHVGLRNRGEWSDQRTRCPKEAAVLLDELVDLHLAHSSPASGATASS